MTAAARRLLPALLPNLRDAGGLTTADGRMVRHGRLLRSSALVALDTATGSALTGLYGAGVYVDLRTDRELVADGEPDMLVRLGWTWHRIPLQDRLPGESDEPADVLVRYRRGLDSYLAIADEVTHLLSDRPLVVGCTLGKDRTGLVTAVLLDRLGVHRTDILDDFALSNVNLAQGRHLLPPRWQDPSKTITPADARVCATVLDEIGTRPPPPAGVLFPLDSVRPRAARTGQQQRGDR